MSAIAAATCGLTRKRKNTKQDSRRHTAKVPGGRRCERVRSDDGDAVAPGSVRPAANKVQLLRWAIVMACSTGEVTRIADMNPAWMTQCQQR